MISIIQGKEYVHEAVVKQCTEPNGGCDRWVRGENVCKAYLSPKNKWRPNASAPQGHCPMATHVALETGKKDSGKKRVGQQKQKKK